MIERSRRHCQGSQKNFNLFRRHVEKQGAIPIGFRVAIFKSPKWLTPCSKTFCSEHCQRAQTQKNTQDKKKKEEKNSLPSNFCCAALDWGRRYRRQAGTCRRQTSENHRGRMRRVTCASLPKWTEWSILYRRCHGYLHPPSATKKKKEQGQFREKLSRLKLAEIEPRVFSTNHERSSIIIAVQRDPFNNGGTSRPTPAITELRPGLICGPADRSFPAEHYLMRSCRGTTAVLGK